MSNDLEAFLRQAAAIRQRKSIEQRAAAQQEREQQTRSRPQYTNARQERLGDTTDSDEHEEHSVTAAEMLPDKPARRPRFQSSSAAPSSPGVASSPDAQRSPDGPTGQAKSLRQRSENTKRGGEPSANADSKKHSTASDLRSMLARPDGVRQAFLLREILNRPRF